MALELEVYNPNDLSNMLGRIDGRISPATMQEIGGPGAGSFAISPYDVKTSKNPNWLNYRNVVKFRSTDSGKIVGACIIQNKDTVVIDSGEDSTYLRTISGEGLRTWLTDAILYPFNGLNQWSLTARVFNWAAEQGTWYVPGNWTNPITSINVTASGSPWGIPSGWPSNASDWIWSTSGANSSAAVGDVYFRYEWDANAVHNYQFSFAGDNTLEVYIDAQLMGSANTPGSDATFNTTTQYVVELGIGHHIVGVKVSNYGGPAGLLVNGSLLPSLTSAPTSGIDFMNSGLPGSTYSNDGVWKCLGYPATVPGWTPGAIVGVLLAEAEARGVLFPTLLTSTFTDTLDTNGIAWSNVDISGWTFDIGITYAQVIAQLESNNMDFFIDPDTLTVNMYSGEKGSYLPNIAGSPMLIPGKNIIAAEDIGTAQLANAIVVQLPEGWYEADDPSITTSTWGRIEAQVASNAAFVDAPTIANTILAQQASPQTSATIDFITYPYDPKSTLSPSVRGVRPYLNLQVGDWIMAPAEDRTPTPRRIASLAVGEDDAGNELYSAELDTVFQDTNAKIQQWLNNLSNGSSAPLMSSIKTAKAGKAAL